MFQTTNQLTMVMTPKNPIVIVVINQLSIA